MSYKKFKIGDKIRLNKKGRDWYLKHSVDVHLRPSCGLEEKSLKYLGQHLLMSKFGATAEVVGIRHAHGCDNCKCYCETSIDAKFTFDECKWSEIFDPNFIEKV